MKRLWVVVLGFSFAGPGCVPTAEDDYIDASSPDGSGIPGGSGGGIGSGGKTGSGGSTFGSGGATFGSGGSTFGSGGATFGSGGATFGSGGSFIGGGGRNGASTGGRAGASGRAGAAGRTEGGVGGRLGGVGGRAGGVGGSSGSGSFTLVAQILGASCGTGTCHNGSPHVDLRNTTGLRTRIVNAMPMGTGVPAACRAMTLVVPGSPSTSLLSQIVKAPVTACGTSRMPDSCSTSSTIPRGCLTTSQIAMIDAWITAGAPM